jgi:hypothetical protein
MARGFDAGKFNRDLRAAQRRADAAWKREVDRVNRENKRSADAYDRKVDAHNKKVIADYNRQVDKVNSHNRAVVTDLNRQLRAAATGPRYTAHEQGLADRVQQAIPQVDERESDAFLSYARIDGSEVGEDLREQLEKLGVRVWFDRGAGATTSPPRAMRCGQ